MAGTDSESELIRSGINMDVQCDSSENWKLALVMDNFLYQQPSKAEEPFELKV